MPVHSSQRLTASMRSYIESMSAISRGDQSLSAMAAVRGQMRESTVSASTSSAHMHASPPRIRAACSGVSCAVAAPSGSTP